MVPIYVHDFLSVIYLQRVCSMCRVCIDMQLHVYRMCREAIDAVFSTSAVLFQK